MRIHFNLAHLGLGSFKPAVQTPLFRLSLICPAQELARITHFVKRDLDDASIECLVLRTRVAPNTLAAHMDSTVRCTLAQRAGLVRLVECLGLDRDVRSVRWETVPGESLKTPQLAFG